MIPPTLVRLNDDWLQCNSIWVTPDEAKDLAKELREDLNWDVSSDGLEEYELVMAHDNGTADYKSLSGDSHLVRLERTNCHDWRECQ